MATLEVEGPDTGWVASIGFDPDGGSDLRVLDARDAWQAEARALLSRLLQEPAPSGRIPGAHLRAGDEDVLYELAEAVARRRPEYRGERLSGYVAGGHRAAERSTYGD